MKSEISKKIHRIKNILIIAAFFCIFSFIISGIYNYSARSMINSEILGMVENDSGNMRLYMKSVLNEADKISSFLLTDNIVRSYIATGETANALGDLSGNLSIRISSYRYVYDYIHSVYIYSDTNGGYFYDGNQNVSIELNDGWKSEYDKTDGDGLSVRGVNDNYPIVMTFIRKTNYGGIIINIDVRKLADIVGDSQNDTQKKYIIDNDGNIVYKYKIKNLGENISSYLNYNTDNKSYIYKKDGRTYAVAVSDIPESEYKCVVENKIDDSLMNNCHLYTMIIIILLTLIGIIRAIFINTVAFNPLRKLVSLVDSPVDNGKSVEFYNDEAKYVASRFIHELSVNEKLRSELLRQMKITDKLKRYALGIQINPHFISSTLNLVHMNMSEKFGDSYDDDEILQKTSQCISYIVRNSNDLVKLGEELSYSRMFVDILEIKCDGEVDISINVAEDVSRDVKIVKLCVNTLIENAFYHGISAKEEVSGKIACNIYRENDNLICTVSDDGVGMSDDEINDVVNRLKSYDIMRNANIGLVNIESRVKMLFGEEYGISIKSGVGKGTEITVRMPYRF